MKEKKLGRPEIFNRELADEVLMRLANGESARSICRDARMPCRTTLARWCIVHEDFAGQYARARDQGLDVMAEDIIDISDNTELGETQTEKLNKFGLPFTEVKRGDMTEHRRLRVEARKWYLSKLAPKRYGDRLALEHSGNLTISERLIAARKRTGK